MKDAGLIREKHVTHEKDRAQSIGADGYKVWAISGVRSPNRKSKWCRSLFVRLLPARCPNKNPRNRHFRSDDQKNSCARVHSSGRMWMYPRMTFWGAGCGMRRISTVTDRLWRKADIGQNDDVS
jgi:hypothetical protein